MRGIPQYTLVWGARYTLGARYLSKNTVVCYFCKPFRKLKASKKHSVVSWCSPEQETESVQNC